MPGTGFHISMLKNYPYRMIWNMNKACNLRCEYCYFAGDENNFKDNDPAFSSQEIADAFNKTGKKWLILMSGGEPFLYPDIYAVLKELGKNHSLQITTNLMECDPVLLKESLPPSSVMMISASLHITTKRTEAKMKEFVDRYQALKSFGYPILVNYVSYPPLLERMEDDIEKLREMDVADITVLTYRGEVNEKPYPGSYTPGELQLISRYAIDESENLIASGKNNYYGQLCTAGQHYFSMDSRGNVFRCGSINRNYGNLFLSTFTPDLKPTPCIAQRCDDCYLGISSLTGEKASRIQMLFKRKIK